MNKRMIKVRCIVYQVYTSYHTYLEPGTWYVLTAGSYCIPLRIHTHSKVYSRVLFDALLFLTTLR